MKKLLSLLFLTISCFVSAQELDVSAEFRPRFEYRHGFKTLAPEGSDAATFVSQRSRINFKYGSEKLNTFISFQSVRVWGDEATLSTNDANAVSIHEAWAQAFLSPKFSLKIGRQEIIYDDQRIFGSVNWVQQARRHDALIAIYRPNDTSRLDFGLALNENSESLFSQDYLANNNKAFQYLWYHTSFENASLSLLMLNNGLAFDDNGEQKVDYNQTIGSRFTYGKHKFKADASLYFQTGKIADVDLSAYNVAANMYYKLSSTLNAGIGAEYLSGTDMDASSTKLKSFSPWFGTNHKFNGWMDYFYVGNHGKSVGLVDISASLKYNKDKFSFAIMPHIFSAAASVVNGAGVEMSDGLGTEIDLSFGYKVASNITFQVGYSQMFATETMEVLKGGDHNATNNWGWAMFVFKPKLFSYKKE